MERMDHDQALSILGLVTASGRDDIETTYLRRREVLERRFETASNDSERRQLASELEELELARHALAELSSSPLPPAGEAISLKSGLVLADRYVVRERIGVGPRAAVFRALDLKRGKDVALKVIAPHILLIPGAFKRLSKAIKKVAILAHPNVCRTLGLVRAAGHTAIVMDLIDGNNLAAVVAAREARHLIGKGMMAAEICSTLRSIAAALMYSRVIGPHLNLIPKNVFLTRTSGVKVTDYAIDRIAPLLVGRGHSALDQDAYRAPETRLSGNERGNVKADARADQYSMAALAYFMATGYAPGPTRSNLKTLRPDLPEAMIGAVERALSMAPEARFADAAAFLDELSRPARKRWSVLAWVGSTAALAAVAVTAIVMIGPRPFMDTPLWPALRWLPGAAELERDQSTAISVMQRVERMRANLKNAQAQLNRRIDLTARQTRAVDGGGSPAPSGSDWDFELVMLRALNDLVTPNVFNSPDVINTANLLDIARDHLAHRRFAEAAAILEAAETVLRRKTADLGQAERVVEQEFGTAIGFSLDESEAAIQDRDRRLRESWAQAIKARREFAELVERSTVKIPAGTFVMGDRTGEGTRSELPVREVSVQAFKLGRYEVTRGEYDRCAAAKACAPLPRQDNENPAMPAINVSWLDANAYVDWLSQATGERYRLPSEAEWEYAARAGTATPYPWGETMVSQLANCRGCGSAWEGPAPVGSFAANGYGLYDMVGNAWEWTADCWYRDYTSAGPDASAREGSVGCDQYTVRGGSWDNEAWLARVSYRAFGAASARQDLYGFRIAKSVD
ncbi:MAG: SUMF1/EgtB/PvdO family nonheme iron enzyme [Rhodobacteraceae bacterium]|nr:SUMF1/EgtB/PvdO family nonheme iron enzyme [Paracoccaceae bacterium]